jgi:hypothetical protein
MDAAELAIYRHHTGRTAPPTKPARYAELVAGRRGGKSRIDGVAAGGFVAAGIEGSIVWLRGQNTAATITTTITATMPRHTRPSS